MPYIANQKKTQLKKKEKKKKKKKTDVPIVISERIDFWVEKHY